MHAGLGRLYRLVTPDLSVGCAEKGREEIVVSERRRGEDGAFVLARLWVTIAAPWTVRPLLIGWG